jgi:hypothetical protein
MQQFIREIETRGGETTITGRYGTESLSVAHTSAQPVQVWHKGARVVLPDTADLTLLTAAGWRKYGSRNPARWATLGYLCGTDDAGTWAVRVPGTVTSVAEAVEWITPAVVLGAMRRGRRVRRQGDVYAVECGDRRDRTEATAAELPPEHQWRPGTRYLVHVPTDGRKHRPLRVTWPARFLRQRVYRMGRSGRRGWGD